MAPIDLIFIGIIVLFGLIGLLRGFARQMITFLGGFFSLIAAILLVPLFYKLLFANGAALASVRETFENLFSSLTITSLNELAAKCGASGGGAILARWIIMFVLVLLLWIVLTIVFKLLKLVFKPLAYTRSNGARITDKVIGVIFGLAIGAAIVLIALWILYVLKDNIEAVESFANNLIPENCLTGKYVSPVAEKFRGFLKKIFDVYKTTIPA